MHVNKINGKRYIGITSQIPEYRWCKGKGYNYNPYFTHSINKYGWDNFEHIIVAQGLSKDEACNMEIELINKYNTTSRDSGYNMTNGGEGILGYHHTKELKEKFQIKFSGENNPFYGKHHSDETKELISIKNKGKLSGENHPLYGTHRSDDVKEKISNARKQKYSKDNHPLYGKVGSKNPKAKKVLQINKDTNEIIKVWGCAIDIRNELGFSTSPIYNCCNNKIHTAYGYKWQYAN